MNVSNSGTHGTLMAQTRLGATASWAKPAHTMGRYREGTSYVMRYVTGSSRRHGLRKATCNGVVSEGPAQSGRIAGGRVGRFACGFHGVEGIVETKDALFDVLREVRGAGHI